MQSQPSPADDNRGETAHQMLMAAAAGRTFADAGVPDTTRNRALFARMTAEVAAIPPGSTCDVPWDHALMK